MTAGLDHVGVVVSDLSRALGFWHGLVGLPVTGRGEAGWPHLSELNGLAGLAQGRQAGSSSLIARWRKPSHE